MQLTDLSKNVQRFLLEHWTRQELDDRLTDPDYFFNQVVGPHLEFLRRSGQEPPRLRIQRSPKGEMQVLLLS